MTSTEPTHLLAEDAPDARPLHLLTKGTAFEDWLAAGDETARAWVFDHGFAADPGTFCAIPGADGRIAQVAAGIDPDEPLWGAAFLPAALPGGLYRLEGARSSEAATRLALGWALAGYRYDRYKAAKTPSARLVWPQGCDRTSVARETAAIFLVRDLINAPAADMGPEELAQAASAVAMRGGAEISTIVGEDLLRAGYPAVHLVGKGSHRAPRLIDLRWGDEAAPRVTLIGKGVCFDSGGLDIKPAAAMKLMKKDMGGAAHALGLAQMVMDAGLPVRLRVLIPAVENAVSDRAMRPLDVVRTRSGKTVEIGHTDAEGRVILADAIYEGASEDPEILIDMATLTGAARVALGPDLPALFANDDALAADLLVAAADTFDPLWRLPLWKPYRKMIDCTGADVSNESSSPYAGAITAGLFLMEFVRPKVPWLHLDLMAWNTSARPGRPEGGEAMGIRALFALLARRFPAA